VLSGFVPFLQIHEEADKVLIQPIPINAKTRVYITRMTKLACRWRETLQRLGKDDADFEDALIPSKMKHIDKYAPKVINVQFESLVFAKTPFRQNKPILEKTRKTWQNQ
jgi:hypothetical protein